jgi:hypothetical protein
MGGWGPPWELYAEAKGKIRSGRKGTQSHHLTGENGAIIMQR